MKNNSLQFKTNINCAGCVSRVKPFLDAEEGIVSWDLDTATKDKILTIQSEGILEEEVVKGLKAIGYKAEPLLS